MLYARNATHRASVAVFLVLAFVVAALALMPSTSRAEGKWKDGDGCGTNGNVVKLHRAAVCTKHFLGACTSTTHNSQFLHSDGKSHYFDQYSPSTARDTYIAQFQVPHKHSTDMIMLAFSGQQQGDGVWNRVTGQKEDYKKIFSGGQYWSWYTTHKQGLVENIWANSWISWANPGRIHVAMSFENSSNWLTSKAQRGHVIDAWVDYIEDHMQGNRKMVTLAGSSRGGCVAYNVARKLKAKAAWEDIPIILLLVDPVCQHDSVEGGADAPKKDNPLNKKDGWFAWSMQNDDNFSPRARKSMTLFQIATGDKVLISKARTFVDKNAPKTMPTGVTRYERDTVMPNGNRVPFYAHQWVRFSHKFLGRTCKEEGEVSAPLSKWWEDSASRFYCPGSATFDPDTQFCSCPVGFYWKWSPGPGQFSCVPMPNCAQDEYAAGDPMVCHKYCPVACQDPFFGSDGGFRYCTSNCTYGTCNSTTGQCTCGPYQYFNGVSCTNYCADPCMKPVWKIGAVPVEFTPATPTSEPGSTPAEPVDSGQSKSTSDGTKAEANAVEQKLLPGGSFSRDGFMCVPKCPGGCWKGICEAEATPADPVDPIGGGTGKTEAELGGSAIGSWPGAICKIAGEAGSSTTCAIHLVRDSSSTPIPAAATLELAYDPALVQVAAIPETLGSGHHAFIEPSNIGDWEGWGWLQLEHPQDTAAPLTEAFLEGQTPSEPTDILVFDVKLLETSSPLAPAVVSLGEVAVWAGNGAKLAAKVSGGMLVVSGTAIEKETTNQPTSK